MAKKGKIKKAENKISMLRRLQVLREQDVEANPNLVKSKRLSNKGVHRDGK